MSAWKQFLSKDISVTPFGVNKGFTFLSSSFDDSDVQIDRFLGTNASFLENQDTTGFLSTEYQVLIYNSVKELYYSNYLSASYGSPVATSSLVPGSSPDGDRLIGDTTSAGRYDNYLETTLTQSRSFPTGSDEQVAVFAVPSRLYGDYVQPESFVWEDGASSTTITDDGNGNLLYSGDVVGNIIYQHGLAVLTTQTINSTSLAAFVTSSNVTCSFSSSYTLHETQYQCTINANEFNFTQNPTILQADVSASLYDFATGSYFAPYFTTIGLYNDNKELLAVAKLSKPLVSSRTTDTNIFVNLDR